MKQRKTLLAIIAVLATVSMQAQDVWTDISEAAQLSTTNLACWTATGGSATWKLARTSGSNDRSAYTDIDNDTQTYGQALESNYGDDVMKGHTVSNSTTILPAGTYKITFGYTGYDSSWHMTTMTGITASAGGISIELDNQNDNGGATSWINKYETASISEITLASRGAITLQISFSSETNAYGFMFGHINVYYKGTEEEFNAAVNAFLPEDATEETQYPYVSLSSITDTEGWTINNGGVNGTGGFYHNSNKFSMWKGSGNEAAGTSTSVYRTLENMPAGIYTVKSTIASTYGAPVLFVNDYEMHMGAAYPAVERTFMVYIPNNNTNLKIGVKTDISDNRWVEVQNLSVTYYPGTAFNDQVLNLAGFDYNIGLGNVNVSLGRQLPNNRWSSLCLPFDMEIPNGWSVKEPTSSEVADGEISITFSDAGHIKAGSPYMVKPIADVSNISAAGTTLSVADGIESYSDENITITGVFSPTALNEGDFFISSNVFYRATTQSQEIGAYRVYIRPADISNVRIVLSMGDDETTGIKQTDSSPLAGITYNIQGQRVLYPTRGIFIKGNKKYVVK